MDDRSGLDDILAILERVPFLGGLKRDVTALRQIVYQRRLGRVVAIGPRRAGKSSLLNLLFERPALPDGEPLSHGAWIGVDAAGSRIDWMELRPEDPQTPERLRSAADARTLDAVLFVVAPEHVEAGLGESIDGLARALDRFAKDQRPAVLPVLARADSVAKTGQTLDEAHRISIDLVLQRFEKQISESGIRAEPPRVVSRESTDPEARPFGLEPLAEALLDAMPPEALIETARALPSAPRGREKVAKRVVDAAATLAITVAITPIPLSDMAVIAPLQALMVTSIAYISGRPWDLRTASEWITGLGMVGGAGLGFRWGAQQLVKLVPGAGSIVSASIAGGGTAALGRSAMAYFLGVPGNVPELPRT